MQYDCLNGYLIDGAYAYCMAPFVLHCCVLVPCAMTRVVGGDITIYHVSINGLGHEGFTSTTPAPGPMFNRGPTVLQRYAATCQRAAGGRRSM